MLITFELITNNVIGRRHTVADNRCNRISLEKIIICTCLLVIVVVRKLSARWPRQLSNELSCLCHWHCHRLASTQRPLYSSIYYMVNLAYIVVKTLSKGSTSPPKMSCVRCTT